MVRKCIWCEKPLPAPKSKGHRRREFCNNRCKQQHYLWHKQMRRDVEAITDPFWRSAYALLVEQYKGLERLMQDRLRDLEKKHKRIEKLEELVQYYRDRFEALKVDYMARLRSLGMSEQDIQEFNEYWERQQRSFTDDDLQV
jgi:hypothetical protein